MANNNTLLPKPTASDSKATLLAYIEQEAKRTAENMAPKEGTVRIMKIDPAKVAKRNAELVAAGKPANAPTLFLDCLLGGVQYRGNGWRNDVTETSSVCARFTNVESDEARAERKQNGDATSKSTETNNNGI